MAADAPPDDGPDLKGRFPTIRDRVLWALCESPGQLGDIQERVPVDSPKSTFSSALNTLRSRGLAETRSVMDPPNRNEWYITEKGKRVVIRRADSWRTAALNLDHDRSKDETRAERIRNALAEKTGGPTPDEFPDGDL